MAKGIKQLGIEPLSEAQDSLCTPELSIWQVPDDIRLQFRRVAAVLNSTKRDGFAVGVLSSAPGEGVTWVTGMLACALSETGRGVVLGDASGKTDLCRMFGVEEHGQVLPRPSFADFLMHPTGGPNLSILSPRHPRATPCEAWLGALAAVRSLAPAVLVDCGSVAKSPTLFHLSAALDGVVVVVEAKRERRDAVGASMATLRSAGVPILGSILNKQRRYGPSFIRKYL